MKREFRIIISAWIFFCGIFLFSSHPIEKGNPVIYKWYRGLEGFGVIDAWKMGYTGEGVNVAVMDSGVDFGTLDMQGAQARVAAKDSPYYGWPIVVDVNSLKEFQTRKKLMQAQYADTSSTETNGFLLPQTSKSGICHIGDHPDRYLTTYHGNKVKVLVVDEKESGVYDTVYVDLNSNRDFRDDKPCRRGDEISYWDKEGDGYPDETGGIIYFIADGKKPLPFGRLLYGDKAKIPGNGELVAFHYDSRSHGTMCAGTIAARGRIVKGIAPGAKIVPVVALGTNEMTLCLLTTLGSDGLPNTGDEANIISRSAGFSFRNKGADELSAFLEYLTTQVSPTTVYVYGNGNEGAGYGTCASPLGDHMIKAGAIVDLWWKESPYRGDVACFSSRGPNVWGQVNPNVLGTGFFSPRVRPLTYTHNGISAWDKHGGGTSNATPHVSAILALIYQAYKDTHGEFPKSGTSRDILMSSATDINEDIFAQGSGIINAKRAVEIASGKNAVLAQPALFMSQPVAAGSPLEFRFSLSNYSGKSVSLRPVKLFKKGKKSIHVKAADDQLLVPIEKELLACDLVKISTYSARDFINKPRQDTIGYLTLLHNWKDLNRDGKYGPGRSIPFSEVQKDELKLIGISDWGYMVTSEIRVHDPQSRVDDGLLLELKREMEGEKRPIEMKSRDVTIVIETYEWRSWDKFRIVREGNEIFCRIQTPMESGIFKGKILLEYASDAKRQCIPISFATYQENGIAATNSEEIYENARLYGRMEAGRWGYRDSRYFPVLSKGDKLVTINVSWEETGSDIDIIVLGQGSVDSSKLWTYPTDPPVKLPTLPVLEMNGQSPLRTYTIHPIHPAKEKTIAGRLKDGINIVGINMTNSGGNLWGENIQIKIAPLAPSIEREVKLQTEAGEIIKYESKDIDRIVGIGKEEMIQGDTHEFDAKKGDVVVLRQVGDYYFGAVYFDSNGNGKYDYEQDEVILNNHCPRTLDRKSYDVVTLPYEGKYFTDFFRGKFCILSGSLEGDDGVFTIPVLKTAGNHLGIPEKDGHLLPVIFNLEVKPVEAVRIETETPEKILIGRNFSAKFKICDQFGNMVKKDMKIEIGFQGTTKEVELKKGQGNAKLTAPLQEGKYNITVKSGFGDREEPIKVTQGPPIEITKITSDEKGIRVKTRHYGDSECRVKILANPSCYLLPELLSQERVSQHMSLVSSLFEKGITRGYLPFSTEIEESFSKGEEKEITLTFPKLKEIGGIISRFPFIIVVADSEYNIITFREAAPFRLSRPKIETKTETLPKLEEIESVSRGSLLLVKTDGLISFCLNDRQPLYFRPVVEDVVSIRPDESGTLSIRTKDGLSHKVTVTAQQGEDIDEKDYSPPSRVSKVTVRSDRYTLEISWQPSGDNDIDHYNVYQFKNYQWIKVGEVNKTEYTIEAIPWNTYSLRISAVDKAGNEGEPSDLCGIVATPY